MGISKTMAEYTKALKDFVAKVLNFTSKNALFCQKMQSLMVSLTN